MSNIFTTFAADLIWCIMRKKILIAVLGALMALPIMAEDVVYLTTAEFKTRIFDYTVEKDWSYKGDKPCVIDFYTTWCGPCKRLAPIMEEMSQKYCDQVVFYKADTERERELAHVFNISSIPQVLYIPTEGKPMLLKGLYPKEEIIKIIDEFLLKKQ
jgi:thioredoxin